MARIRSLHPGQWTDEAFVSCSPEARLLALGLRNEADDQGVFEWKPLQIKMRLFPADNFDIRRLLDDLSATGQLRAFEWAGKTYGAIRNFRKWQRPEKPKALHPLPDELREFVGLPPATKTENSENPPVLENNSATGRQPVGDQSAKVSAEEGDKMKEEGGRREEEKEGSLRSPSKKIGSRLPGDWLPSQADEAFAKALGLNPAAVADEFRDYWRAVPGAKGLKLDWSATYRNSCRMKSERSNHVHASNSGKPSQQEQRYQAGIAGLARTLGG